MKSEKARAENVMIVDLLRNDLGRLAATGSVRVPALFTAECYPTVWQLTSTIEAQLPPAATIGVVDLMRALFPCGSVTGAPKIRTMEIIAALEPEPRGVYTGAIGLVRPGGDAVFSVAIRTLVVDRDTGEASLGIGAGIVADSKAGDEYDECLLKGAFVDALPVSGAPAVVRVPPAAQRDFELIETVLVDNGAWQYLTEHLDRMGESAQLFRVQVGSPRRGSGRAEGADAVRLEPRPHSAAARTETSPSRSCRSPRTARSAASRWPGRRSIPATRSCATRRRGATCTPARRPPGPTSTT